MSYIGRNIDSINNISTLDNLSFNGSDATFNLTQNSVAFVPVSADALQIQIDGVIQANNYSVNNATVTFDFVPSASSVCNNIRHFGVGLLTTVSDGAVTTAKLGADSVNGSKIADDSISDEHLDITAITGQTAITSLADTDKFLVSDASDSGNLKYVEKQYLPSGNWVRLGGTDATGLSDITYDNFSSTYQVYKIIGSHTVSVDDAQTRMRVRKSGSDQTSTHYRFAFGEPYRSSGGGGISYNNAWNADHVRITQGSSNAVAHPTGFEFTIYSPFDSTRQSACYLQSFFYESGGANTWKAWTGSVWLDSTTGVDITGIKFYPDSGTFTNAKYSIYGLKDS